MFSCPSSTKYDNSAQNIKWKYDQIYPPPSRGFSLVGCLVLQLVRRVRFPTLPLVMLTAMMLSMLSLASWGSKHPTRVLREPIQRVDLDWDRLNATQARTAARNPTSLTPTLLLSLVTLTQP